MKKITPIIAALYFSTFLLAQTTWKADIMYSKLTFSTVHRTISDSAGLLKNI